MSTPPVNSNSPDPPNSSASSSFRLTGWNRAAIVAGTGAALIAITMGLRQSFGLLQLPYTENLALGREAFSLAIAMQNLMWGFASPFFGAFADRRGPVPAAIAGVFCYVAGLLCMAAATGGATVVLAQMLVGLGMAGAGFSVVLGAVGKAVRPEKRSLALAFVTAGGSLGQFALVPVARVFIDGFGATGGVVAMAGVAALMLMFAPGLKLPEGAPRAGAEHKSGAVLGRALHSRDYVLLSLGFFVCGFQVVFVATHFPAYLQDMEVPNANNVAAWSLALVGLFNIFGTLACGWLGDRFPKKNVLTVFYLMRSVVMILFLALPLTGFSALVFGALIGLFWLGTVPLTSGLIAVFFGPRHMSMLYGVTFLSHQAGSFLGAWSGGAVFDATGSYDAVWTCSILLGVFAAAMHWPIRERRDERFAAAYA